MAKPLPTFENWTTVEKLGEGGMCAVYRVQSEADPGVERAIKVLLETGDDDVERFAAEARLLLDIDHPNILKVHELNDSVRPPWIVMELLAGQDLEELRATPDIMDPEHAAKMFADVSSGLAQVHEHGIRHRDIKPANIMLGHDGVARLIDFGIARETGTAHKTRKGFLVGTASYLPPEIFTAADGQVVQDLESTDVYALGQSLCEVLTGEPIHSRDDDGPQLLVAIMRDKLERPYLDPREWRPQVPDDLAEIVKKATMQDPKDRIPSAKALERALRDWLMDRTQAEAAPISRLDPSALPAPPTTDVPVPRRNKRPLPNLEEPTSSGGGGAAAAGVAVAGVGLAGLLIIGGIVLLLVAGGAWFYFSGDPRLDAVQAALEADQNELQACSSDRPAVDATLTVSGGKITKVDLDGKLKPDARACLVSELRGLPVEGTDGRFTVKLPLPW